MLMKPHKKQSGFTLIELMIAMVIGLILMLGAVGLLISNNRIYTEQTSMARLQENARFAIEIIIKDIRMAGYAGCAATISNVNNNVNNTDPTSAADDDNLLTFKDAIEGSESAAAFVPSGAAVPTNPAPVAGTDGFGLRFLAPSGVTLDNPYLPPTAATTKVNDNTILSIGDVVAMTDCADVDIFQITNLNSSFSQVTHNSGTGTPGNSQSGLSKTYGEDSQLLMLISRRYYIGNNADGVPSLYRYHRAQDRDDSDSDGDSTEIIEHSQELIEGVENMQLLYGEDTGTDRVADTYVNAAGVTDWEDVVSVRLALLFRTIKANRAIDINTRVYDLLGTNTTAANDYLQRRVVNATVQLRNRQSTDI